MEKSHEPVFDPHDRRLWQEQLLVTVLGRTVLDDPESVTTRSYALPLREAEVEDEWGELFWDLENGWEADFYPVALGACMLWRPNELMCTMVPDPSMQKSTAISINYATRDDDDDTPLDAVECWTYVHPIAPSEVTEHSHMYFNGVSGECPLDGRVYCQGWERLEYTDDDVEVTKPVLTIVMAFQTRYREDGDDELKSSPLPISDWPGLMHNNIPWGNFAQYKSW